MCIYTYTFIYVYKDIYSQVNMMEDCNCILCRDPGLSHPCTCSHHRAVRSALSVFFYLFIYLLASPEHPSSSISSLTIW